MVLSASELKERRFTQGVRELKRLIQRNLTTQRAERYLKLLELDFHYRRDYPKDCEDPKKWLFLEFLVVISRMEDEYSQELCEEINQELGGSQ